MQSAGGLTTWTHTQPINRTGSGFSAATLSGDRDHGIDLIASARLFDPPPPASPLRHGGGDLPVERRINQVDKGRWPVLATVAS